MSELNLLISQVPILVDTKMLYNAVGGNNYPLSLMLMMVTPDSFARAAVRWIGHGGPLCIPHVTHQIQCWISSLLPEFILDFCCLRQLLQLRESILRSRRISLLEATQVNGITGQSDKTYEQSYLLSD